MLLRVLMERKIWAFFIEPLTSIYGITSTFISTFMKEKESVKELRKVIRKYSEKEYRLKDFPLDKKELRALASDTLLEAIKKSAYDCVYPIFGIIFTVILCREIHRVLSFNKNKGQLLEGLIYSLRIIRFIITLQVITSWAGHIPGLGMNGVSIFSFLSILTNPLYNIPGFRDMPLNILPMIYVKILSWVEQKLSYQKAILSSRSIDDIDLDGSLLDEQNRTDIVEDALVDGSSFICSECGAVIPIARADQHRLYWCQDNFSETEH